MKNTLISLVILLIANYAFAQISEGGLPYSFKNNIKRLENIPIDYYYARPLNLKILMSEDSLDNIKGRPFRFGYDIDVSLNLNNSGTWTELQNGDRLWRLAIKSDNAFSINLIFDKFHIPPYSYLYIYNKERTQILGKYTSKNNSKDSLFATTVIKGDEIVLEYYEKDIDKQHSFISISKIIHGYKNIFFNDNSKKQKSFGGSGTCNINVNCDIAKDWQKEKRAVAMILLSNNTRICSGCMVNNPKENQVPYFLTAFHCVDGYDVATWVFMFNYESVNCDNNDGNKTNTILGSDLLTYSYKSDFALLRLKETPPDEYNVYYAGWSNIKGDTTDSCVTIHHPSGDIKKISFAYNQSKYSGDELYGYSIEIPYWDIGTTEGGSSGAPLFNKKHKILGQLYGGDAACYNKKPDYFGSFHYSWHIIPPAPLKPLHKWLDPDSISNGTCEGRFFNIFADSTDLQLVQINNISKSLCNVDLFVPEVKVKNIGQKVINNLSLNIYLNNTFLYKHSWTGTLDVFSETNVIIDTIRNINLGVNNLKIIIDTVNYNLDDNRFNDTITVNLTAEEGTHIKIEVKTDNYGEETKFYLINTNNGSEIIYESNDTLFSNSLYTNEFCLPRGNYYLKITDSEHDGLCTDVSGNKIGYFKIYINGNLFSEGCNFKKDTIVKFSINNSNKQNNSNAQVYPNPFITKDYEYLIVETIKVPEKIILYDYLSKPIANYSQISKNTINNIKIPKNISSGLYILKIIYTDSEEKIKIIIN